MKREKHLDTFPNLAKLRCVIATELGNVSICDIPFFSHKSHSIPKAL